MPVLLTEHGIYTRERKIEIAQADWIYVKQTEDYKIRRTQSFFKQWWINLFRFMSRLCYQEADRIITITQVNQPFQIEDGADPAKMSVIPNGIKINRFGAARAGPRPTDEFMVGFVGRVVPIKDVKTFIRAIKMALADVPHLKAYIIGPTDEDPEVLRGVPAARPVARPGRTSRLYRSCQRPGLLPADALTSPNEYQRGAAACDSGRPLRRCAGRSHERGCLPGIALWPYARGPRAWPERHRYRGG